MIFISEPNNEHRCFGTKLEKGEVIQGEDFFLENTTILGWKVKNLGQILGEDFFFREHRDFGKKSKKSMSDFMWKPYVF